MNYPKIYNTSGDFLAVLDNINENTALTYRKLNADFTLEFQAFEKELKSDYIVADNIVESENQRFDIKYIDTDRGTNGDIVYSVECEHVSYRLLDEVLSFYAFTGTPTAILTDLLSGTDFSVGTVDSTGSIIFVVNEETTKFKVIQLLAAAIGAEIEYTALGFTINLLDSLGSNNGFEIRVGKNLTAIKRTIDNRGQLKTYYQVNYVELKNSDVYIQNGFDVLEVVELGDTVKVKDPLINVDIENQILSRQWNPIKSVISQIELTNSIELTSDEMVSIQTASVNKNELLYGVLLNNDIGLQIERNDELARTQLNADKFAMQASDGVGGYDDKLYFDPIAEEYKFVGDVDVTGTITSASIISSDITGSTITGGTIRTSASGQRIELSSDDLRCYNSIDQLEGIQLLSSESYGTMGFYDGGTAQGGIRYATDIEIFAFGSNGIDLDTNTDIVANAGGNITLNGGTSSIIIQDGADVLIDADDDVIISADDDISMNNGTMIFYMNKGLDSFEFTGGNVEMFLDNDWGLEVNGNSVIYNQSAQNLSFQIFSGELEVFDDNVYQFTCSTKP